MGHLLIENLITTEMILLIYEGFGVYACLVRNRVSELARLREIGQKNHKSTGSEIQIASVLVLGTHGAPRIAEL